MAKAIKLQEAMRSATHVSNEVDLKTAIQQGKLVIISDNRQLYARMLEKFPMEKVSKRVSYVSKVMMGVGVAMTLASGGLLGPIGIPLAGTGLAGGIAGNVLDDYNNYNIRIDYDQKQVQFIKTKGNPHVKI